MNTSNKSRLGAGLAAGAILGLAAGMFLNTRQGKQLTKDMQKKATALQKQVMKKLVDVEDMSREKYEEMVDYVLAYYAKTKEIAAKDVPEVRNFLMKKWKEIEAKIKEAGEDA